MFIWCRNDIDADDAAAFHMMPMRDADDVWDTISQPVSYRAIYFLLPRFFFYCLIIFVFFALRRCHFHIYFFWLPLFYAAADDMRSGKGYNNADIAIDACHYAAAITPHADDYAVTFL